jgi:hypothetical protein
MGEEKGNKAMLSNHRGIQQTFQTWHLAAQLFGELPERREQAQQVFSLFTTLATEAGLSPCCPGTEEKGAAEPGAETAAERETGPMPKA